MLKNYKLIITYDGTSFFGWQIQKDTRTVQGVIEKELKYIFKVDDIKDDETQNIDDKSEDFYNFCTNCGIENKDKYKFCIECGNNLII